MLEADRLNVAYAGVSALHDVSIRVETGQIITVIGPNGAGKTTLLNAIMGVHGGTGSIQLAGRSIERTPVEARVRAGMSLVPEKRELFASLSVEDNLRLGAFRLRQEGKAALSRGSWTRCSDCFPGCESAVPNWPERSPEGSGRCSQWGAR